MSTVLSDAGMKGWCGGFMPARESSCCGTETVAAA